jgi:hypothetical protein
VVRLRARALALAIAAAAAAACSGPDPDPQPFCDILRALERGEVALGESRNELAGHVASLDALIAAAPAAVRKDLRGVRDRLAEARDAGGLRTLLVFSALQDSELAAMEGRVTEYVARTCGVRHGPVPEGAGYRVGEPAGSTRCPAWPRAGSPLTNNRFPYLLDTSGANYFATQFWSVPFVPAPPGFLKVERGGWVELRADYPHARYFALHPNDVETNNLDTLRDVELDPDPGSANPWREPVSAGAGRRYTARLVFGPPPENPAPNTVYVGERARGGFNPAVFLLLRIYGADQGSLPPNAAGALLPSVTIYGADGRVREFHEACDPYPPGYQPPVDTTRFPVFPVPDFRAARDPGGLSLESTWGMPVDLLANRDVFYLSTFYGRQHGEVFAVRFAAPRTPSRRRAIPPWDPSVEARMLSLCTYNFWNGAAIDCRLDETLAVDAEGRHTVVVSDAARRPLRATAEHGVTWMDAGPFLDGQLTWRFLFRDQGLPAALRGALETGRASNDVARYLPERAFCSREDFDAGGFAACRARSAPARSQAR